MTTVSLPEALEETLRPLFESLPPEQAINRLVVPMSSGDNERVELVEQLLKQPELKDRPDLAAGLWLYVDELDRSHQISQGMPTPTGSFWHAIMHRREGDFSNSKYWYRRTGKHPAMSHISMAGGGAGSGTNVAGYDPADFVDRVERAHQRADSQNPQLVSLQKTEWTQLFQWCAEHESA